MEISLDDTAERATCSVAGGTKAEAAAMQRATARDRMWTAKIGDQGMN
jgi:hypothetical protein